MGSNEREDAMRVCDQSEERMHDGISLPLRLKAAKGR